MKKLLPTLLILMASIGLVFAGCGTNGTTSGVYVMTKITCKQSVFENTINAVIKNDLTVLLTQDGIITQKYFDTGSGEVSSLSGTYRLKSGKIQVLTSGTWKTTDMKLSGKKITFSFKNANGTVYVAEYTKI